MAIMCNANYKIVIIPLLVIMAAMAHPATAQLTQTIVGDTIGWRVPPAPFTYSAWASTKTFLTGDTLVFNFGANEHDVVQVPKASYDACTQDNAIGQLFTAGPANFTLDAPGDHFFICTIGRHCQNGQKLAITVVASTPGAARPPSPSGPGTAPPPASNTPTEACPPELSPTGSTTPVTAPPPFNSASTSSPATVGLLIALLSGAVASLF